MAHALLADLADLEIYGLAAQHQARFVPQVLEITISTGGALGTMGFQWRRRGETTYKPAVTSTAGSTWVYRVSEGYADLTFVAGAYVLNTTYTVWLDNTVTAGAGALNGLTATRFDIRSQQLRAATDDAIGWMEAGGQVVAPITAWGTDIRSRVARLAVIRMEKIAGIAPGEAGSGTAVLLADEERIEAWFRAVGKGNVVPRDFADSSGDAAARGEFVSMASDALRGW